MKSECHNWADSLAACGWLRFPGSFFSFLFIPSIVVWTSQPITVRLDNNIHFIEAQAKQNYCCVNLASGFKRITARRRRTRAFFVHRRTFTIFFLFFAPPPPLPSKLISNSSVFLMAWSGFFFLYIFSEGEYVFHLPDDPSLVYCYFSFFFFPFLFGGSTLDSLPPPRPSLPNM